MSKYAVLRIQGHQYKVSEGEEFLVDKLTSEKPEAEVLLTVDDKKIEIGKPTIKGAKITLKVVEPIVAGEKVYVAKFKPKSRERRRIRFRPKYSKLLVQKIS